MVQRNTTSDEDPKTKRTNEPYSLVPHWIWSMPCNATAKTVFGVLRSFDCMYKGHCWPSEKAIANKVGLASGRCERH